MDKSFNEISEVKTLIYELFSGVGFCNQLFSLETAIYLANISNRKLILLIRNPLCHCGKASWDYGYFLNYFSNNYKSYLPYGIEVYYRKPPSEVVEKINISEKLKISSKYFSNCVFIDEELNTSQNKTDISKFANGRNIDVIDYNSWNNYKYLYISQSNASRCFYNFYTSKERYIIMNKICESLTYYNETITSCISKIITNFNYNAIHFRFGDSHKDKSIINHNNQLYLNNVKKNFTDTKTPLFIMTDRKDNELLKTLQQIYSIKFTDEYISNIELETLINTSVYKFIIEKSICQNSENFNGTIGSTVSNYIQYNRCLLNKPHNKNLTITVPINNNQYSWETNLLGSALSFSCFYKDNIYSSMNSVGKYYFRYVRYINIQPQSNKKIISFCLYDIEKTKCDPTRKTRNFYKGIFINYHEAKIIYPDWIVRIYMLYDEPYKYIKILESFKDIEVILVDTNICLRTLRFLPNDDKDVNIWLSRDLDSIVNWREKAAVDDWLINHSDKDLHIMNDSIGHNFWMAGLFGYKNNNNNKKNILEYILNISNSKNISHYSGDAEIAKEFFYNNDNHIQHYNSGLKFINYKNFPSHKPISCSIVGNIINIDNYFENMKLKELYPILNSDTSNNIITTTVDKYYYLPWKCNSKDGSPICTIIWYNDDFIMTIDPEKKYGHGTFKTENSDGKKLMNIGTKIKILWENCDYKECFMSDENTIIVMHGNKPYQFTKILE